MDFDISNIEGTELFGFLDLITAFYIESGKHVHIIGSTSTPQ